MPPPFHRTAPQDLSPFGGAGPKVANGNTQTEQTGNFSMKGLSDSFGRAVDQFSGGFTDLLNDAKGAIGDFASKDPTISRLLGAGINKGADPNVELASIRASSPSVGVASGDHRVRLSLPYNSKVLYNKGDGKQANYLLQPLVQVGGVVFPYTPQLIFQHNADYARVSPTHSNYPMNFYQASNVSDISMFGEFTSENGTDARYVLAVITFLRAVTKMFSNTDDLSGNPPPVLRLSGHGQYMLPSVPVVVNTVSITMPNNVDYITIPTGPVGQSGNVITTRVPKSLDINIGMTPVYSRAQIKQFGVERLADGQLVGGKQLGGFI